MRTEKEILLRKMSAMSFAALDVALFLDSHPFNREALEHHHYYNEIAKGLKEEYEEKYGPLSIDSATSLNSWDWIEGNWPWKRED